ncbi:MAG: ABC transporter permease [Chloroflexota bacterium]
MRSTTMLSVVGGVAFLLLWKLIVVVGGYPVFILPPPEIVGARLLSGWASGQIGPHAAATLVEVALGFGAGAALGLIAGYGLGRSSIVARVVSPYLVAAQATPILALAPVLALWFGPGLLGKVVIAALIVFFPVAVSAMVGIRSVDTGLLELGRSLRATPRQVLLTLEIPAALPSIFGGLRIGITLAVVGAIVGEWAGAERGLGVLVNIARGSLFDIPLMFATLVTIAAFGVALYLIVVMVERRLVRAR